MEVNYERHLIISHVNLLPKGTSEEEREELRSRKSRDTKNEALGCEGDYFVWTEHFICCDYLLIVVVMV